MDSSALLADLEERLAKAEAKLAKIEVEAAPLREERAALTAAIGVIRRAIEGEAQKGRSRAVRMPKDDSSIANRAIAFIRRSGPQRVGDIAKVLDEKYSNVYSALDRRAKSDNPEVTNKKGLWSVTDASS
jgi:hypothetical protein